MPNLFFYIWSAVFGLVFGSFLNVVILRDKERKSILNDRSRCPICKHVLAWYDLVPLLSWVTLRGRCRYCRAGISAQYPLVELAGAALAVFSCWYGYVERGSWLLALLLFISFLLLLAISVIDIRTMEIPDEYCYAAAVFGVAAAYVSGLGVETALIGLAVGSGAIAAVIIIWKLVTGRDGMGWGDVWVAGAAGSILGWPLVGIGLMAAVFTGAIIGVLGLALKTKNMRSELPFGPYLALGMLMALVWGQTVLRWYIL